MKAIRNIIAKFRRSEKEQEEEQQERPYRREIFVGVSGLVAGLSLSAQAQPQPYQIANYINKTFPTIAAMSAANVPPAGGGTYEANVAGYGTAGDGGGGIFLYDSANLVPVNNVVHFAVTGGPGRWVRQVANNVITLEMAGGAGDYLFPEIAWAALTPYSASTRIQNGANIYYCTVGGTSAASGGPTGTGTSITDSGCTWQYLGVADSGTDNTGAINAINNFIAFNGISGWIGGTVSLRAGGNYLIASDCNVISGAKIKGEGWRGPNALTSNSGIFSQSGFFGAMIVVDPTVMFSFNQGCQAENFTIVRRNINSNPTTAQVTSFVAGLVSELSPSHVWLPATAYSSGNIVANVQGVYKCSTSGTSGAFATGGPTGVSTVSDSIIDGTAKWFFLNQLQWAGGNAYVAGAVVTSFDIGTNHLNSYVCDTGGTASTTQFGPSGVTTGTNSIIDGTCKWHFLGKVSVGLTVSQGIASIQGITVVGFAVGVLAPVGLAMMRNCYMDNLINLDLFGTGDTNIIDHVHCIPIYIPTADAPVNTNWGRKPATAIFLHDHADTPVMTDCEAVGWAVGVRISNIWGLSLARVRIETGTTNVANDACFQLRNVCSYIELAECYAGGVIGYDIGATDGAHATTTYPGIGISQSAITVRGGQAACPAIAGATQFKISGNANGSISDVQVNMQGCIPFVVSAANGGVVCWNINSIRLDEATVHPTYAFLTSGIDSSMLSHVHFSGVWDANQNRWAVPTGYDDSVDVVASPTTGGSHTIADSTGWCFVNNAGTLATYTVTMPANPLGNGEVALTFNAAITGLTISPNSGQTIPAPPTSAIAHATFRWKFIASTAVWTRMIMQ